MPRRRARGARIALAVACGWLLLGAFPPPCRAGVEPRVLVLLLRPVPASEVLSEAILRIKSELTAGGFEVAVADSESADQAPDPRALMERAGQALAPSATIGIFGNLEQGDYVAVDSFPNATPGWTVATWVQIASTNVGIGDATVISTEDVFKGGWEMNLTALQSDLRYHFGFWTGPGSYDYAHYECLGCIHPDRWQHLAAVVDGAAKTLTFCLDGVLQVRQTIPRPISPGVSTLTMGRWATTDPARLLVGSLDDIAIWSRPLMSAEIALLTQAAAP